MRRSLLAFVFVLAAAVASAQTVPLSVLDVGPVFAIQPIEADGAPGMEFLIQVDHMLTDQWLVVYPQHPSGLCKAGPIATGIVIGSMGSSNIADFDGDGRVEIMRFDFQTQTVSFSPLPTCR